MSLTSLSRAKLLLNRPFVNRTSRGSVISNAGMTLLEIIIVVAILGSLAVYLMTNITQKAEEAKLHEVRISMGGLEQALQMYRIHNNRFPTTEQGLEALMVDPGNAKRWKGPYVDSRKKLKDPWDNPFEYTSNGTRFEIVSAGPDFEMGTEDDIYYPERDDEEGAGE